MSSGNRRNLVRWQVNKQAKIKIGENPDFVACQIRDLNLKGIQVALEEKLEKDKFLKLSLILSSEFRLSDVEAWVAWHKVLGGTNIYGLYFNKLKGSDKEQIYKFTYKYCSQEVKKQWWKGTEKGGEIMQNENFEDRRIFARFPAKFPLKFLNLSSNAEGQAETYDVSAKGLGLISEERLHPNTPLEMWLNIPDRGEPLYTRGEVVWSNSLEPNKYRIGIELDKADLMGMSRVLRAI